MRTTVRSRKTWKMNCAGTQTSMPRRRGRGTQRRRRADRLPAQLHAEDAGGARRQARRGGHAVANDTRCDCPYINSGRSRDSRANASTQIQNELPYSSQIHQGDAQGRLADASKGALEWNFSVPTEKACARCGRRGSTQRHHLTRVSAERR